MFNQRIHILILFGVEAPPDVGGLVFRRWCVKTLPLAAYDGCSLAGFSEFGVTVRAGTKYAVWFHTPLTGYVDNRIAGAAVDDYSNKPFEFLKSNEGFLRT